MDTITKILNDRDKILLEKAFKFYFFTRQQDVNQLNSNVRQRFSHAASIAYSLIVTYIREGNLKLEYMDFLNGEIKTMISLKSELLDPLLIKPDEIDEIEFNNRVEIKVYDEDYACHIMIRYNPTENLLQQIPIS